MNVFSSFLLGLVQGVTEFLPISSSGHLSILQNLFHMSTAENGHLFFDVLLHLGTLISICIVYWRDIRAMVRETLAFFRSPRLPAEQRRKQFPAARMVLMIVLATLPRGAAVWSYVFHRLHARSHGLFAVCGRSDAQGHAHGENDACA